MAILGAFIKYFIFGVFLYLFIKAFSPKGRSRSENGIPWTSQFTNSPSFVAMEYFMVMRNRTLRVLIEDTYICGIKVGSDVASQGSAIAKTGKDPEFYVNEYYEQKYSGMKIGSGEMLGVDKANFIIKKKDIANITYHKYKWGMVGIIYSGRIVIKLYDGSKKELILLGKQSFEKVREQILSVTK